MNRLLFTVLLLFVITNCFTQDKYIYTALGNKVFFNVDPNRNVVMINGIDETIAIKLYNNLRNIDKKIIELPNNSIITSISLNDLQTIIEHYNGSIHSTPLLSLKNNLYWASTRLFVKIKKGYKVDNLLNNLQIKWLSIREFGIGGNSFLIDLADYTSVEVSNQLFESGFVIFAQPDWGMIIESSNNPLFNQQWNLRDTINGYDINVSNAWALSQGENVRVAVLDEGVELTHPDLIDNLLSGYDATDGALGGVNGGNKSDDRHGTGCAGIIAAANNNIGVKGIAYKSKIIPVRIAYRLKANSSWYTYISWIADGIHYAWNNADILNNSWSSADSAEIIKLEISNALKFGRNGKGCVVVFSSGNYSLPSLSYTASLDSVISVGAISPCGERKSPNSCDGEIWWGSNYGEKLCVVAPGVKITTTDLSSNGFYRNDFNGTSAACPHVTGVAALILSVNPNLTAQQVKDIIESTAQKINTDLYSYNIDYFHTNGEWNRYMGYGLVDAYSAVKKALPDLYIRDTVADMGLMPSNVTRTWCSPDIWITNPDSTPVNEIYNGRKYKVWVRVHNRDEIASSGTERLFLNWAKAGFNEYWNDNWTKYNPYPFPCFAIKGDTIGDLNGIPIPSIPAYGYRDVGVLWWTPIENYDCCTEFMNEKWHYCILARVHDDDTIAHENEQFANVYDFIRNHNNVASRNVTIKKGNVGKAVIQVNNPTLTGKSRIICLSPKVIGNISITDYAEVYITLDAGLLTAINSANISGLTWVSSNTLRWNGGSACIPVTLPANSYYTMMTTVHFLADQIPATNNFDFDIVLRNATGDSILGGEHYKCVRTNGRYFQAVAHDNMTILWGETASLYATDILETAEYKWYDDQGNEVGDGLTCNVSPQQNTNYTLRVTADADGYRAYSTVTVMVVDGELRLLAPNPADNQVRIGYALSRNVSSATLQILNGSGQVIYSQSLSGGSGSKVTGETLVNTSSLAAGSYTVRLISSRGNIFYSKTLVIR